MASDWLAAVLPPSQMPCLKIFVNKHWFQHRNFLVTETPAALNGQHRLHWNKDTLFKSFGHILLEKIFDFLKGIIVDGDLINAQLSTAPVKATSCLKTLTSRKPNAADRSALKTLLKLAGTCPICIPAVSLVVCGGRVPLPGYVTSFGMSAGISPMGGTTTFMGEQSNLLRGSGTTWSEI